ncbi:MAG: hypothetical protein GYA51_01670 [Candidatus Methanofastidiosa archaeon]|nr:hypothetical protein [Candidatus Methanofastidiosa archaeon]
MKVLKTAIAFSVSEFKIINEGELDQKQIIVSFIKSAQDFKLADKYTNGIEWNYTDEKGITKQLKMKNFGPYSRDLITTDDLRTINYEELLQRVITLVTDEIGDNYKDSEYNEYLVTIEKCLSQFIDIEYKNYQLTPPESKTALLSPFTLEFYLCFFCVNLKSKSLNIIQVDDY